MARVRAVLLVLAAAVCVIVIGFVYAAFFAPVRPAPVPSAWFCRVWTGTQLPDGSPACVRRPATFKPPWPYLGRNGEVVTPQPSPQERPS